MDALVTAFVATFLAAWGDKTQRAVASLAGRSGRPASVLAGLALAAVASSAVAGIAGAMIAHTVTITATSLLAAVALLFAGVAGLIRRETPAGEPGRWPLLSAAALCLVAEIGERGQLLTFALAARFDSAPLAAAGGAAGLVAACLPAALLGDSFERAAPVRAIRYGAAALFLIAGFIVAVRALGLA
jgi:putative Ca2+/H+ antiporter (TMEM165/GDT1 family)